MTPVKCTLQNFGVHDIRDISCTKLFSDILDAQGWFHRDCLHWVERDGFLHIVNISKMNKGRLVFEVQSPVSFVCLASTMVHDSLPF